MKLQIALDDLTMEEALVLMDTVQNYVDIIEIGTPFIYEYGMEAVRTMKKRYPDKEILADMKIMDAGYYEAEEALKAGADYVTVLAVTDLLTIQGCVKAAQAYGSKGDKTGLRNTRGRRFGVRRRVYAGKGTGRQE